MRRDATENRARLVASARKVFAERGLDATLDEIAAHAGVGVGTAYRHFKDKHELAGEVLRDATQLIVDDLRDALAIDDPWRGLVYFFETTARRQANDRTMVRALVGRGRAVDKERLWPEIVAGTAKLFARARKAGVIRRDAKPEDAVAIFAMVGALPGEEWRRYLPLVLDGLRAVDSPKLPGRTSTYKTFDDMTAVTKNRRP